MNIFYVLKEDASQRKMRMLFFEIFVERTISLFLPLLMTLYRTRGLNQKFVTIPHAAHIAAVGPSFFPQMHFKSLNEFTLDKSKLYIGFSIVAISSLHQYVFALSGSKASNQI